MPNRRHSSRRFTPSCSNSITNSTRCDMIDFSDNGIPDPPQQAKDADRMRPQCLRTPVHYLPGLYTVRERVPSGARRVRALAPTVRFAPLACLVRRGRPCYGPAREDEMTVELNHTIIP